MAGATNEPSMEDILSSIKKIIAEDSAKPQGFTRTRGLPVEEAVEIETPVADSYVAEADIADVDVDDEILELTQSAPADPAACRDAQCRRGENAAMPHPFALAERAC